MKIGSTLKMVRNAKGLRQEQLSEMTEISVSYLSLIENDKREPTLSTLKLIADAMGVPVFIILFLSNEDNVRPIPATLTQELKLASYDFLFGKEDDNGED